MKCFHFSYPADRREDGKANNKRSIWTRSLSGVSNMEGRRSGFNIMTQSDTDVSISMESSMMTSSPSSKLSNHLRVFTFAELKTATRCFSRSLMLGEGGFGSVYKGWIKCIEESHKKIEVAVKQLNRKGLQVCVAHKRILYFQFLKFLLL